METSRPLARDASAHGTAERPADVLLALSRAGRLAERFPQVTRLLAEMSGPELVRAGQLLHRVGPDAVLAEHPDLPVVRVAVTGHGTLSALLPPLTAELARHALVARPYLAPLDNYVFDLSDPGSALYAARPDLVLCVLDPMLVLDELPVPWTPADLERVTAEKARLVEELATRFERQGGGTLVLNTVPLLRRLTGQLVDYRSRAAAGAVWREFNTRLLRLADDRPAVVTLDLDPLTASGVAAADARLDAYAKAHLSADLLAGYAREVGHLARHLTGRTDKCLVLDLDETLWGGVLGEDGAEGIEIGEGYRGEAFTAFQRVVRQLGSQGVLLAAVSKNDAEPVRKVLDDHPAMTLRSGDFVRVTANWRPKHENLRELADALNLSVASLVFADDSPYERGLVRRELPEVAVLDLDGEPALHIGKLLADDWFAVRELTAEDRSRGAQYREEAARGDFLQTFDSLDDYLRELDVTVRLSRARESDVPRLSQLTLRTNQFNCTTWRLQPAEVAAMAADPALLVLPVHAADRFGSNGMIGAVFGRRDGAALHLDNFVLSCRVFSRGIEHACLAAVLRHARATGATEVLATYRRSPKNSLVKEFYPRYGFALVADDGTTASFRHDLRDIVPPPPHVRLTELLGGHAS